MGEKLTHIDPPNTKKPWRRHERMYRKGDLAKWKLGPLMDT